MHVPARVVLLYPDQGPHHARPQGLLRDVSSRQLRRFGRTKPHEGGGVTKRPHESQYYRYLCLPPKQHRRESLYTSSYLTVSSSQGLLREHREGCGWHEEGPGLCGALGAKYRVKLHLWYFRKYLSIS